MWIAGVIAILLVAVAACEYRLRKPDQLVLYEADGTIRRRPSFAALAHLHQRLHGCVFFGPLPSSADSYLYRYACDGRQVVVGWSLTPGCRVELPAPPIRTVDRDGRDLPTTGGPRVDLGPSPVYFEFDSTLESL